jgi:hypothetical protein
MKCVVLILPMGYAALSIHAQGAIPGRDWIMAKARMKRAIWPRKPALARITLGALSILLWSPPVFAWVSAQT